MDEYIPKQYVKRPIAITAQRMRERFTVKTMEGTLEGKPGDWLMTGVQGEQYPCDAGVFARTYLPASEARSEVDARDAEIAQLRADLARVTAERGAEKLPDTSDHPHENSALSNVELRKLLYAADRDRAHADAKLADALRDLARVTAELDREAHDRQTAGDAWNDMRRQRDAALVERDAARADITVLNRALADERAAVAIAHERIAEVTAELDNARSRVVEQIEKSLPHAMQNAKAVYKYDVNESRARAMAVLIVDEAIQCLHFDDTRESIRAHAAGSGKGGDDG